jgi:hypothetical protein
MLPHTATGCSETTGWVMVKSLTLHGYKKGLSQYCLFVFYLACFGLGLKTFSISATREDDRKVNK